MTDVTESGLRRFHPYPAYKDSGVEWLGEVPEHWGVKPLKFAVKMNPDDLPDSTPDDFRITYVDIGSVTQEKGINWTEEYDFLNAPSRARRRVRDGDTIISTVRTYLKAVAAIQNPPDNMVVSTGFAVLRPTDRVNGDFLSRAVQSDLFISRVVSLSEGVGYPAIAPSTLARIDLWLPPTDEQVAIAAFLDRETARIDELVAKKERLIELLQEKRTALITRAVTKGLDPNVPMKDSGVRWLGEVPKHWEIKRIKWVAKMESGHTPDKKVNAYWEEGDIPWVSLNDTGYLKDHDYIDDTAYHTNQEGIANSSARLLPPSAVVFSRDATIGRCAITTRPMAVSQHFIAWICGDEVTPEYLLQVFKAMTEELERLTMGATIRTIGLPDVKTLVTPVLPKQEQLKIVDFIINRKTRIDILVAKVREAIEQFKEYRTALISAAVTGKIDVREEVSH